MKLTQVKGNTWVAEELEASMRFFVEHLVDRGDLVLSVADRIVHYAPAKQ